MGGVAGGAGGGASASQVFAKFLQNLPFLPQILAFLCLQPPHFQIHSAAYGSGPHPALQAWHRIDVKGYRSQEGHWC